MGSKGHLVFSLIKSVIRIIGFYFLFASEIELSVILLISAEFLGILEEFYDKR